MIIDAHAHLWASLKVFQKSWLDSFREYKKKQLGVGEEYEKWETSLDGRVENLISDMDEAGVDKAIAISTSPGVAHGEPLPEISIWRCNEYVAEAQNKYPDRIIGFARVDPLRKDAVELLVTAIEKLGLKGIKLHPTVPVTDEAVQPVMSKLNELEIPILFHMGVDPIPFLTKHGDPTGLDTLVQRYPKIKVIAAHHARGFGELLTAIITQRQGRIYSDLAAWQYELALSPWQFTIKMRALLDKIPQSVLMGTDWPFLRVLPVPYKQYFDCIRNLQIPKRVLQLGLGMKDFSQEEKDLVLGENARVFLGI